MVSIISKAIKQLSSGRTDTIISNYLNMPYDSYTFSDRLYASRLVLSIVGVSILAIAVILVVMWVARRRQQAAEEAVQRREKYQLQILAALSQDYSVIYYVDLDQDQSKAVRQEKGLRDARNSDTEAPPVHRYSEAMRHFIDSYVQPDTKESLLELCDPKAVICRFREEKGFTVRYRILPDHRKQEFFEMHFVDVSESEKEHTMVLGIRCVDEAVHEEQTQKQLLQDALESANRASAAKSDFMSKMSHDIRTPMNAIIGMTAIASVHAENPDRVREALGKISSSSRYLLGLINEVLDMSKVESGTVSLASEKFNLSDLLNSMLQMIEPQIQAHKHSLKVHVQDIRHENVIGDSLRIQQVFLNFMSNAIKYTPDGGEIRLTVQEQAVSVSSTGCYVFVIEDNGIGMSREYLEHIFEPFSRAEDLRTSKIQGTGLGMAIAQNIVHMMNGNITVESEPGKGSKFTVTIYLKLQEEQDIHTPEAADLPLDPLLQHDFSGRRVLLVEDNELNREIAREVLEMAGLTVEEAVNGQIAVDLFSDSEAGYYSLILMDIQMPVMNGYDAAAAIRALDHPDAQQIPILAMTANAFLEDIQAAKAAGMNEHLAKPIDFEALGAVLKKYL